MNWSNTPPTEQGWYWLNCTNWPYTRPVIVEVFTRPAHEYLCISDPATCEHTKRNFLAVDNIEGSWAGPIGQPDAPDDPFTKMREFIRLATDAIQICDADPSLVGWEIKFDQIFDMKIGTRTGIYVDYYDPDTTYEGDTRAYVGALRSKISELEAILRGESR